MAGLNLYPEQAAETRLVMENAYGSLPSSPAWKRINGFGVTISPDATINAFRPKGTMVPTLPMVDDVLTTGTYEGVVDFNGFTYLAYSVLGYPAYSALGGSPAAYQRVWEWDGRGRLNAASYGIHYGFPDSAAQALGAIFNSMQLGGGRPDGFTLSGDLFAKPMTPGNLMGGVVLERQTLTPSGTISGGTWKITYDGFQTAAINHNAVASAIQTALEALPNVEPGDIIVAGGPISSGPVTLDFSGNYAGKNVSQVTVDVTLLTGTTPGLAVATTTPGADAVTDVKPVPGGAITGNVFLDTSWAGVHTTQVGYALGMNAAFGERLQRVTPINKSQSTDYRMDVAEQDHNLTLTLAQNAVADAQIAKFYAGQWSYPSIEWEGDTISGANKYLLRLDASVFYTDISDPGNVQGALTRDYAGQMGVDPVSGKVFRLTLVNEIANPL